MLYFLDSTCGDTIQYLSFAVWLISLLFTHLFHWLISFGFALQIHLCCCKWWNFILFYGCIVFYYIYPGWGGWCTETCTPPQFSLKHSRLAFAPTFLKPLLSSSLISPHCQIQQLPLNLYLWYSQSLPLFLSWVLGRYPFLVLLLWHWPLLISLAVSSSLQHSLVEGPWDSLFGLFSSMFIPGWSPVPWLWVRCTQPWVLSFCLQYWPLPSGHIHKPSASSACTDARLIYLTGISDRICLTQQLYILPQFLLTQIAFCLDLSISKNAISCSGETPESTHDHFTPRIPHPVHQQVLLRLL